MGKTSRRFVPHRAPVSLSLSLSLARSSPRIVSTDPPYYDNIGYADLSDFFYVWLRRSLKPIFPRLFATMAAPKTEELIASPYRQGDKDKAEAFFLAGMTRALKRLAEQTHPALPATVYYAFKQSERKGGSGIVRTGWETFLDAAIRSGFSVTGAWPMRTELGNRMGALSANALASSVALACRKRPDDAPLASLRGFMTGLRYELTTAIRQMQAEGIAPVDLAQAAIGPGMAVFSRHRQVLHADGEPVTVRDALREINRTLDAILAESEGDMDADTRFCVAWFEQYRYEERRFGEAEVLFKAKNTSLEGLKQAGVIVAEGGKIRLKRRDELTPNWDPKTDKRVTDWECVQHLVRELVTGGGETKAGQLVHAMGPGRAANARNLAYRLFKVSERRQWNDEARAQNFLIVAWPEIQKHAYQLAQGVPGQLI